MSPRLQSLATLLAGAVIALFGLRFALFAGCCSGRASLVAYGFAAFGLALAAFGLWCFHASSRSPGLLLRNPLYITIAALAVGAALLAHEVHGFREERVVPLLLESGAKLVLRSEADPNDLWIVEDAELERHLRGLPSPRVEATFEIVRVFGVAREVRLVRVGGLARPQGFVVTSGLRGSVGTAGPTASDE